MRRAGIAVAVSTFRKEASCFVLLTNVPQETEGEQMGYASKEILEAYKDQYRIEQDFGFLKDPVIVNSVFLRKPERIEVVGLILLTSQLILRFMERSMRQYVEQTGENLPGWKHKPTDNSSSKNRSQTLRKGHRHYSEKGMKDDRAENAEDKPGHHRGEKIGCGKHRNQLKRLSSQFLSE